MSDTPRTEASAYWFHGRRVVDIDGSRTLEVELAAMTGECDEARAEALEQARLNGIGSEREARLMARVQEARAELARLKEAIPAVLTHIDDIGARGYYSGRTLEGDAAIEVLRAALKETK
jgi:hypothetical protein